MKYLVAVSGGIDSVVLLDMLVSEGEHELTVGHFDHGIRSDAAADERFVCGLAAQYGLPYVHRREELGSQASEETARLRRYAFLHTEAKRLNATLVTAHHADDAVETMAINLIRGTGWRGIAVLDNPAITRPLLSLTKPQIRHYALKHRLEWVEDSTNSSDNYLRNRIRRRLVRTMSTEDAENAIAIWRRQVKLKREIDADISTYFEATDGEFSRYFFVQIPAVAAVELLRSVLYAASGHSHTRPQLERALNAVKTARPSTVFQLGDTWIHFKQSTFTVTVKTL